VTVNRQQTTELLEAITERLAEIFASDHKSTSTDAPIYEQYAAGVSHVLKVTETLKPTYENPAARCLEFAYLDAAGGERMFCLWEITLDELLRDKAVRVPAHELSWSWTSRTDASWQAICATTSARFRHGRTPSSRLEGRSREPYRRGRISPLVFVRRPRPVSDRVQRRVCCRCRGLHAPGC